MAIYGTDNGNTVFSIPVEWAVYEHLQIRADSLEEAVKFVQENEYDIPFGDSPEYIDGSYKISVDGYTPKEIAEAIDCLPSHKAKQHEKVVLISYQDNSMFEKDYERE